MALIPCPECGGQVSTRALACPHCGGLLAALTPEEPVPAAGSAGPGPRITLSGTSAGAERAPRELDLIVEGEEVQLHVHPPGGSQPRAWVRRDDLQRALDEWSNSGGGPGTVEVPARTARKAIPIALVFGASAEVEVQAGWWIWVKRDDLRAALEQLGLRAAW
jgi:hypothetical protein